MAQAFICDAVRTPIGKLNGSLSSIRADDLAALPLKALMARNGKADWSALDDVILGCANQAVRTIVTSRAWLFCWRAWGKMCRA